VNGTAMDDLPTIDTDVLVVGAGPTGLMAGLVLTRRGVPVVVVDRKAEPTRESRALAVQARTMEIYDQLGIVATVLAHSHRVTRMQIGQDADPQKVSIDAAQQGSTRYPGIHIFEQSRNEELLWSALAETGNEVRALHRLVDLVDGTDRPDGRIVVLVEGPEGLSRIRARWCVGADGASSTVRRLLDVPFEGVTDDATFWVADLRGVSGLRDDAIAVRFGDATFALSFPLGADGHTRLISLAAGEHVNQEVALGDARSDLGLRYAAVDCSRPTVSTTPPRRSWPAGAVARALPRPYWRLV
jgi:2-polyprenyl-6-methoxyphenol hydroxylase-like FAD-dependent oxidoreductase